VIGDALWHVWQEVEVLREYMKELAKDKKGGKSASTGGKKAKAKGKADL
jgi:hypothetical protein